MSGAQTPPFRADHVGSLLRPQALLRARADLKAERISAAEFKQIEDDAVREVAKLQEDLGLQGVTDGEVRRGSWHMDFLYQVGGVTRYQGQSQDQVQQCGGRDRIYPVGAPRHRQAQAGEMHLR